MIRNELSTFDVILFYALPLAIGGLLFATEHYIFCVIYIIGTALHDFLPKYMMNKEGDARFLFLLYIASQILVTIGGLYALYLVIKLIFF